MYILFDYFFMVFHGGFVLFALTGWAWRKTRRIHLAVICLTFLSWFGLGVFYGWGYCPCTDWHWSVKRALGETHLPDSYVKYYADLVTGRSWDPAAVDAVVLGMGLLVFGLSCSRNYRDLKSARECRDKASSSGAGANPGKKNHFENKEGSDNEHNC